VDRPHARPDWPLFCLKRQDARRGYRPQSLLTPLAGTFGHLTALAKVFGLREHAGGTRKRLVYVVDAVDDAPRYKRYQNDTKSMASDIGTIRKGRMVARAKLNSHGQEDSDAQDQRVCRCRRCDRDYGRPRPPMRVSPPSTRVLQLTESAEDCARVPSFGFSLRRTSGRATH
jgi:hypothetical protein